MIKLCATALLSVIMLMASIAAAQQSGPDPFPRNHGTIYEYDQEDLPSACFFPIDKARWNGYLVTTKNWTQLTDFQKTSFINEGIREIEKKGRVTIEVKDRQNLVSSVNSLVMNYEKASLSAEVPILGIVRDLLKKNGSIVAKSAYIRTP